MPEAGAPPTYTQATIPRYRNILDRGHGLYLVAGPGDVDPFLAGLPPEGLVLGTFVETED